jgi:hypothetical protein
VWRRICDNFLEMMTSSGSLLQCAEEARLMESICFCLVILQPQG